VTERQSRLLVGVLAFGIAYVLVRSLDAVPYDDSYFFKRFALNALHHGSFAWNVADGPVNGLTSQLFGAIAVGVTLLAPSHYVVATKLLLALCLTATAWTFVSLVGRTARRADVAVGVTLLALGNPLVLKTIHTGMETALALLAITLSLRAILEGDGRTRYALEAALVTTLVYLCRPDAVLIPALTFLVMNIEHRRRLALYVLGLAGFFGAVLGAFKLFYGTAFPLPFYAKTYGVGFYDAAIRQLDLREKALHVATFAAFVAPLVALCRPRENARARGLCMASAVFVLYHLFATTEIMGYRARFYVPAFIPIALAAAFGAPSALTTPRSWRVLGLSLWAVAIIVAYATGAVSNQRSLAADRVGWASYIAHVAIAGWLWFSTELAEAERPVLLGAVSLFVLGLIAAQLPRWGPLLGDRRFLEKSSASVTTTRGIFDVERCLPNTKTLYHSEIGVPALVLPDARVVDLVGLMSRDIALEQPKFDTFCQRDRPEAIFLPHKNYAALNREIQASACLREYTRMVRQSSSPLYVRNDLAPAFRGCARDVVQWQ
jgi:hypothetical protein